MLSKEERIKNLKQANEKSHKNADRALKETLYQMLETKKINEIFQYIKNHCNIYMYILQ